jgi:hypothetical protein
MAGKTDGPYRGCRGRVKNGGQKKGKDKSRMRKHFESAWYF